VLESVCYQTVDLLSAMRADWPDAQAANLVLRVDGGMAASDWTMQRLADLLDAPVDRPMIQGNHGAGCGLSRRPVGRRLSRARKIRRQLAAGTPLQAEHEPGDTGAETRGLGARGKGAFGERRGGGVGSFSATCHPTLSRHHPRKRVIQYSRPRWNRDATAFARPTRLARLQA